MTQRVGRRPKIAVVAAVLPSPDAHALSAEDLAWDAGVAITTARKHAEDLVSQGVARRVQAPPRRRAVVLYARSAEHNQASVQA